MAIFLILDSFISVRYLLIYYKFEKFQHFNVYIRVLLSNKEKKVIFTLRCWITKYCHKYIWPMFSLTKKNMFLPTAACPWNVEARHGYCYVLTANEFDYEAARDGCMTHGHGLLVWFEDAVELEWIIDIVETHYLDSDKDIFIGRYTYIYVSLMNEVEQWTTFKIMFRFDWGKTHQFAKHQNLSAYDHIKYPYLCIFHSPVKREDKKGYVRDFSMMNPSSDLPFRLETID